MLKRHSMIKLIHIFTLHAFLMACLPNVQAGEVVVPVLPKPGALASLSSAFVPAHLTGIVLHPEHALQFDFLVDPGDGNLDADQKNQEYEKLVKYFLASLAVPEKEQWVNLSPYEKDRIVPDAFGKTDMGQDLLAQDYLLKQISASLMYPESGLGKMFWDKVYAQSRQKFGNAQIPQNTFNKVWIVPDTATVYESGQTAYLVQSRLTVMMEEDYLAVRKQKSGAKEGGMASQIIREVILPELEREINEGKNFAQLRQIYSGMLLATWFKKALRESLLSKMYADKAKLRGIERDPQNIESIYEMYLTAFKKGAYNYIKEEKDPQTASMIPKKYFAGGIIGYQDDLVKKTMLSEAAMVSLVVNNRRRPDAATVDFKAASEPAAVQTRRIGSIRGAIKLITSYPSLGQAMKSTVFGATLCVMGCGVMPFQLDYPHKYLVGPVPTQRSLYNYEEAVRLDLSGKQFDRFYKGEQTEVNAGQLEIRKGGTYVVRSFRDGDKFKGKVGEIHDWGEGYLLSLDFNGRRLTLNLRKDGRWANSVRSWYR